MKKLLIYLPAMLLIISSCLTFTGCDKGEKTDGIKQTAAKVDYDLTALGVTVTAALIPNMNDSPSDYIGKTVRGVGQYQGQPSKSGDVVYHYILFPDSTGCCYTVPMEILWNGHSLSEFPAAGTMIAVSGTFGTYTEGSHSYPVFFLDELQAVQP